MNVLSLCSGIGGLDLGIRLACPTARTICYVEREIAVAALLVARMADEGLDEAPVWSDLTTFDGTEWRGLVDCVCAGYPCQPFSVSGLRGGADDPRHLWPHVARTIRECSPSLVLIENVPGHLSLGFQSVCEELAGMGYRIAAGVFSAVEVGASHERCRLYALAHRDHEGLEGDGFRSGFPEPQHPEPASGSEDCGRVWNGVPESSLDRVADGVPDRVDRVRALGNGVVPLVAAHALRTLSAALLGRVTNG